MHDNDTISSHHKFWNFLATIIYIVCWILLGYTLQRKGIKIEQVRIWELFLLALATYRLTRILVFDKIFKLFRDFIRSKSKLYAFYVVREIITCPWCAGVWTAMLIVILYFLVPFGNVLIYLLAISGLGSFFVIIVNYFGLSTEEKQHKVRNLREYSDYSKPE